jgi:hypothetical protein
MWKQWLTGLCVVGAVAFLLGCESEPQDECSGIDDVVSCASVVAVSPFSVDGEASFDIDVVQDLCVDDQGAPIGPEPFGDHFATVTFRNDQFPNASTSFPIVISSYRIEYEVTSCPPGATCPELEPFEDAGQTITIQPGSEVSQTYFLVPLNRKAEFVNEGGQPGTYPNYRARYTFKGSTAFFDADIKISGSTEIEFGNFNLCD